MVTWHALIPICLLVAGVPAYSEASQSSGTGVMDARASAIGHPSPRHTQAQSRLMARRAAEVRGVRELGRAVGAGDRFVMHGFRYESYRVRADGVVEVTVVLPAARVRR